LKYEEGLSLGTSRRIPGHRRKISGSN